MINWKRRCLSLAKVVDRHRRDRMHNDMKLGWEIAKELINLNKIEEKAQKKFMEHWRCPDKKKWVVIYDEYLELIRQLPKLEEEEEEEDP